MTFSPGVIDPSKDDKDEMFVGWAKAPKVDRRFLLGALPLGLAGAGGAGWLIANNLDGPGPGSWLNNATHSITGALVNAPYPMLRMHDPKAPFGLRSVLIVAEGKCLNTLKLGPGGTKPVTLSGSLIERKGRQMLSVPMFGDDWISGDGATVDDLPALANPPVERLGAARLAGQIMDSKCFFGVMRPGQGKTHKACASLCIRGGIPPSFWVRSANGEEAVLLMTTADGEPMPMDILPFVADPVEAEGEIVRVGDLLQFRADASAYKRI